MEHWALFLIWITERAVDCKNHLYSSAFVRRNFSLSTQMTDYDATAHISYVQSIFDSGELEDGTKRISITYGAVRKSVVQLLRLLWPSL